MTPLRFLPVACFASALIVLGCAAYNDPGNGGGGAGGAGATTAKGGSGGKHGPGQDTGATGGTTEGGAGGGTTSGTTTTSSTNTDPLGGAGGGGGTAAGGGGDITCHDTGTPQTFYISSDDSSSMGSPALAREYLNAGKAPPQDLIRIWEFLNYYRVRYDLPSDDKLGLHAHFTEAADGKYHLQIGVQSFGVARPQMALTFVVDTSGSLVGEGMAREREAIRAMAKQLRQGDHVSFVKWSNKDSVLLSDHVVTGPSDATILDAIDALQPGGGSDLHAGLSKAYELAEATRGPGRLSRVVLISDGGANLGVLDADVIAEKAKHGDDEGIYLVGIGIGPAPAYSDSLMNQVTDAGRGAYVYLDSTDEADKVLGARFDEVMDISARAVQVSVTLPSYIIFHEFLGEGISQNAADVQPQHLAPGDSMIFEQVLGVTPGAALCDNDAVTIAASWSKPLLHQAELADTHTEWTDTIANLKGEPWQLLKAEAITLYAKALKNRSQADFDAASAALDKAKAASKTAEDPDKGEIDEIAALLQKFPQAEITNP